MHPGSFDICHIKDTRNHTFATRKSNIFIIGKGPKPLIALPAGQGAKDSILENRKKRLAKQSHPVHSQNDKKKFVKAGSRNIHPLRTQALRKKSNEKKKLLRMLRAEDVKQRKRAVRAAKGGKKKSPAKKKGGN